MFNKNADIAPGMQPKPRMGLQTRSYRADNGRCAAVHVFRRGMDDDIRPAIQRIAKDGRREGIAYGRRRSGHSGPPRAPRTASMGSACYHYIEVKILLIFYILAVPVKHRPKEDTVAGSGSAVWQRKPHIGEAVFRLAGFPGAAQGITYGALHMAGGGFVFFRDRRIERFRNAEKVHFVLDAERNGVPDELAALAAVKYSEPAQNVGDETVRRGPFPGRLPPALRQDFGSAAALHRSG